jgi:predicted phage terminase large subunit-like protein
LKLTSEIIEGFTKLVLSKNFDGYQPTPDCHREWWELCTSEAPLVAICAPRGHAKSTAITHCYTLASVLFKDRQYVIIVSDTYEQAVLFLQDIKKELIGNEDLISLFGVEHFEKDAENDIIVRLKGGHRFRIVAKGAEQKMRGLKWDNRRPDLIICDDLENDEIVQNQERREKFRKWFDNALLPCRSDRGIVRVVGTILHLDSLLERLMPKDWDRKLLEKGYVVREPLRSYYNFSKRKRTWFAVRYRAHSPNFEAMLWPEKWSRRRLEEERQRYIDSGNPEGYAQEYLNYPIDETYAYFRKGDFQPMTAEMHKMNKLYYVGVDLAISETTRADYTVFVIGGMDENNKLHIVDVIRERLDAQGIVERLIGLKDKWDPDQIVIEGSMIEKSLGPFINEEMAKKDKWLNITTMMPTKDKETRARSIQGRMRASGVYFDKEADWYSDLEQEMLQFPKSRHDDQVDALAWLGLLLDQMSAAQTPKEIEEDLYEEEKAKTGWFLYGQSETTGY